MGERYFPEIWPKVSPKVSPKFWQNFMISKFQQNHNTSYNMSLLIINIDRMRRAEQERTEQENNESGKSL